MIGASCNFVYFVDEYNSVVFGAPYGFGVYVFAVNQLVCLLVNENFHCVSDHKLAFFVSFGHHIAENIADIDFPAAHTDVNAFRRLAHVYFHGQMVEIVRKYLVFYRFLCNPLGQSVLVFEQKLGYFVHCRRRGFVLNLSEPFVLDKAYGNLYEVSHHAFHVPSYITDLCVFGGLDFKKWRFDKLCKSSRNFGFSYAGRAFENNVFRRYFLFVVRAKPAASVTVAQRHRHDLFCLGLTDYIFIQLVYYLSRSQFHVKAPPPSDWNW